MTREGWGENKTDLAFHEQGKTFVIVTGKIKWPLVKKFYIVADKDHGERWR